MQQRPQLRVGPKSHMGKVRSENQDRMSRFVSPLGEVFIVADGMGGHQGGGTAALMTTEGFLAHMSNTPPGLAVEDALQDAATKINEQIFREANSGDPATEKMGSTVVLALVSGSQVRVAHAGDSRAYLFRNGQLRRLTKDHSAVQRMIDHNMLTEAEARDHPDASVILRAFGQKPEIELEISPPLTLQNGDGLLLCSDGLCGYVDDAEIVRTIGDYEDPQQVADALVELALAAGGEDNVTVQFLQFGQRPRIARGAPLEGQMRPARTKANLARPDDAASARAAAPRWWQSGYVMVSVLAVIAFIFGWFFGGPLYRWSKQLVSPEPSPTPTTQPAPQQPQGYPARSPDVGPTVGPSPTASGSGQSPAIPPLSPPAATPQQGGQTPNPSHDK
jgi:protein phosphatase